MKRCAVILWCVHLIISTNAQSEVIESVNFIYPESANFSRRLAFNDTIELYAYHADFEWSILDLVKVDFLSSKSILGVKMKDANNNYVVYVFIEPSAKKIFMQCVIQGNLQGPPASKEFGHNPWGKWYNILLIFTNTGIKLFLEKEFFVEVKECTGRIPEIVGAETHQKGIVLARIKLTLADQGIKVPGDWHIRKHVPLNHRIIIEYFPDNRHRKCNVTIRLTDKNEIVALTVTIDYNRAFLFTKRDRYDDGDVECLNFGSSLMHLQVVLGRVEIEMYSMLYKVRIETNVRGETKECTVEGHYYSPYDIYQAIFDSTEKESIPYRYYIKEA